MFSRLINERIIFLRPCLTSEFPEWKELVFICIFQDSVGVVFLTLECILPSNCMFNVLPGNRLRSLQRGALALGDFSSNLDSTRA